MTTETLTWFSPAESMPDDDETVMLAMDAPTPYPPIVDIGWRSGDDWRFALSGAVIPFPVIAWAPMPTGPRK